MNKDLEFRSSKDILTGLKNMLARKYQDYEKIRKIFSGISKKIEPESLENEVLLVKCPGNIEKTEIKLTERKIIKKIEEATGLKVKKIFFK